MLRVVAGEHVRLEMGHSVSAPHQPRMKMSREGLLLIKSFEGFRPQAVRRRDGILVIGYGHTRSARPDVTITELEAELLLQYDLLPVMEAIHQHVPLPLNQHQFDALASFILSVGLQRFEASDVLDMLKAGSVARAALALSTWPDRTPPPVDTLYRRRSAERALFDTAADSPACLEQLLTAEVRAPNILEILDAVTETPATTPILRHEQRTGTALDKGDPGAIIFIGGIGLLALTAGLAGLCRSMPAASPRDGSILVGALLAISGLTFLGAAAWNLSRYRHNKRAT